MWRWCFASFLALAACSEARGVQDACSGCGPNTDAGATRDGAVSSDARTEGDATAAEDAASIDGTIADAMSPADAASPDALPCAAWSGAIDLRPARLMGSAMVNGAPP